MLLLVAAALAEPPGPILASPEGSDAPLLFREQAKGEGKARELVCDPLVEGIVLCFRVEAEGTRRYVTEADLVAWQTSRAGLRRRAAETLDESPLVKVELDGGGHYWQSTAEPGREGTVLLHPEWLAAVGEPALVAVPARGALVAWAPGDPELDKIVAVGARQMFDQLDHPVSPTVMRLSEGEWSVWGEAKPR